MSSSKKTRKRSLLVPLLFFCGLAGQTGLAEAQTSSLFRRWADEGDRSPLTMDRASYFFIAPPPAPKQLSKNDHLRVCVDFKSRVTSEGEMQPRKTANIDAILSDFPIINGLRWIKPSPQSDGDPRVKGQITQQFRALGELETSESLKQEIACKIVDIRPNGILVLEGHDTVIVNDEVWEFSITGECDPAKIDPSGVLLDRDLAHKQITKREHGHVRQLQTRLVRQLA